MPELKQVLMELINEPEIAMRAAMDPEKLRELAESMGSVGLVLPIAVFPVDGRFEIEDGHRRFLAARELGWKAISAVVYQPNEVRHEAAKLAANLFREDITAAEEAIFFDDLVKKHGYGEAQLCAAVGRGANYISDRLRLLRGDEKVFYAVLGRKVSFGVGRELNKVNDDTMRRYFLDQATRSEAPVRVVTQWISDWKLQGAQSPGPTTAPDPDAPAYAQAETTVKCFLCGGSLDPYNLETVYIHRWEKAEVIRLIKEAGEGAS